MTSVARVATRLTTRPIWISCCGIMDFKAWQQQILIRVWFLTLCCEKIFCHLHQTIFYLHCRFCMMLLPLENAWVLSLRSSPSGVTIDELGTLMGEDFRWLARDLWKNQSSFWPRKSEVFLGLKDPKRTDFTIHNHVLKILTTCRDQKFFPLYQEPTITPTTEQASFEGESWKWRQKSERKCIQAVWQVKEFGLKKPFGSPNGAMRRRHTQALQHWSVSVVSLIVLFTDP